jgi:hypothetical protein
MFNNKNHPPLTRPALTEFFAKGGEIFVLKNKCIFSIIRVVVFFLCGFAAQKNTTFSYLLSKYK